MHIKFTPLLLLLIFLAGCTEKSYEPFNPVDYVDPFIGSAENGNTNPGATTPWGMVTMTPHNINRNENASQGESKPYEYGNEYLYGFSHTAISGSDCHSSGGILIMPVFGDLRWKPDDRKYRYSMETASPGYYKVKLDEDLIFAEMTATTRTGLSRFRFQNGWAHIVLDISFGSTADRTGMVRITAPNEIVGYTSESLFCGQDKQRKVYFVAQFDRTTMGGGVFKGDTLYPPTVAEVEGKDVGAVFSFRTLDGSDIQVKVGISYVSIDNARLNLSTEQPNFSFALTRQRAREQWEKALSKILVYGGSETRKKMFYTALYHSLLTPHIFQDVNGDYPLMNKSDVLGHVKSINRYSVYSLPNTYHTLHPLLATIYPSRQLDMVHSLVGMYLEKGRLPAQEMHGAESKSSIGDPAAIIISDTFVKGVRDFDVNKAYEALRHQATLAADATIPMRPTLQYYDELGYIPYSPNEAQDISPQDQEKKSVQASVSATLEYALADWTIAQLAKALGKTEDADFFAQRSQNYKNLFHAETGFFRPRWPNGDWLEPFDPLAGAGFIKGSAWNSAFFVPHDIPSLIALLGQEPFITRLQAMFENNIFDIAVEANLAFPFLFNYVDGQEWRTQKTAHQLVDQYFSTAPNGLPAADALGTLSAWLVWTMIGLYPDCPVSNQHQISTPFFERIEIAVDSTVYAGEQFVIDTENLSDDAFYIKSMRLNGKRLGSFQLPHDALVQGGRLRIKTTGRK